VTINLISPEEKRALAEIEEHWKITQETLPKDLSKVVM
jgi:hypothetical protein